MVLKKKEIIAASLVVLIGVAGYLNWSYQDTIRVQDGESYVETGKKLGEAQYVSSDTLGPNGCGKTTFLKTVYRITKPDLGAIYRDGRGGWHWVFALHGVVGAGCYNLSCSGPESEPQHAASEWNSPDRGAA